MSDLPTTQLDRLMRRSEYINRGVSIVPTNDDWLNKPFGEEVTVGQITFEQKEKNARDWLDRHTQTPDHQLHLCSDACHYLTWALFELDNTTVARSGDQG